MRGHRKGLDRPGSVVDQGRGRGPEEFVGMEGEHRRLQWHHGVIRWQGSKVWDFCCILLWGLGYIMHPLG